MDIKSAYELHGPADDVNAEFIGAPRTGRSYYVKPVIENGVIRMQIWDELDFVGTYDMVYFPDDAVLVGANYME